MALIAEEWLHLVLRHSRKSLPELVEPNVAFNLHDLCNVVCFVVLRHCVMAFKLACVLPGNKIDSLEVGNVGLVD